MKKLICLVLCAALLSCIFLTGCGAKEVTAEDLVSGAYAGKDPSGEMEMTAIMVMTMPYTALDLNMEGNAEISMNMSGNIEYSENISHSSMVMDVSLLGISIPVTTETWSVISDENVTTYTSTDGSEWTAATAAMPDSETMSMLSDMDASMFKTLTLEERSGKDDDYVVSGTLDMETMMSLLGDSMNSMDLAELMEVGVDLEDLNLSCSMVMHFDSSSLQIKTAEMAMDCEIEVDGEALQITMNINMVFLKLGGVSPTLPESIPAAA